MLVFLSLTVHLSQVRAVDLDEPPNNFIIYSIVSGDPKQQFSIDPRSGHVTVRSMLDREEVGFTFTPESLPRTRTCLFYQGFCCICWIVWSQMNILICAYLTAVIECRCRDVHIFIIPLTRPPRLSDNALLINRASCRWRRSSFILSRSGDSDRLWRQRQPTDVLTDQSQPRSSGKNTNLFASLSS